MAASTDLLFQPITVNGTGIDRLLELMERGDFTDYSPKALETLV